MANNSIGSLLLTLGVQDNTAKAFDKAFENLKNVDGAVSKLNKRYQDAQHSLEKAMSAGNKSSSQIQALKDTAAAWELGVKNARIYQAQLNRIESELTKIQSLRTLGIGFNTAGLDDAESSLRSMREALRSVRFSDLKSAEDAMSKFSLSMNEAKLSIDTFKSQFNFGNASKRVGILTKALDNVKKKLIEVGAQYSLGKRAGLNTSGLSSSIGILSRLRTKVEQAVADPTIVSNENKYLSVINSIESALSRVSLKLAEYNAAKRKSTSAASAVQSKELNAAKLRDVDKVLADINKRYNDLRANPRAVVPSDLQAKIAQLEQIRAKLGQLSEAQMGKRGFVGRMLQSSNYSSILRDINKLFASAETGAKSAASAVQGLAGAFDSVHNSTQQLNNSLNTLKSMFLQGGMLYATKGLLSNIVQTGGMIEQQHIALRSMLGDYLEADKLFGQIQNLAIESPFTFSEMIRDTKQLVAFGVEEENVYETTKRLADISAGLGVSFERLGLAFGQTKARGWLDGKELRQFAYAGLPLLSKLSQLYTKREGKNVSTSEVRSRITKRNVPFEDVRQILWDLTDEGGQFFNMQDALVGTLLGKYNKLKDAWDIMLSNFTQSGNVVGETMKGILDVVAELIESFHTLSPLLASMGVAFGGRSLIRMISGGLGLGNITKDIQSAARLQMQRVASKQLEAVLEGKLTQAELTRSLQQQRQTLAQMQQNGLLMQQLALQGSLKPLELQTLMRKQQQTAAVQAQNVALIEQLVLTGQISAAMGRAILSGSRMQVLLTQAKSKIASFFSLGNIFTAALAAAGGLYASVTQFLAQTKEKAEEVESAAIDAVKNIKEEIEKHSDKPLTDAFIGDMQAALKQSNQYTVSMDEQISRAETLADKYEIIKGIMEDMEYISSHAKAYENALNASKYGAGVGFWDHPLQFILTHTLNDSLKKNLKDLHEAQTEFDDIKRINNATPSEVSAKENGVNSAWNEIINDDVPDVIESLRNDILNGHSWADLSDEVRRRFAIDVKNIVDAVGEGQTDIGAALFSHLMQNAAGDNAYQKWVDYYWANFKKWRESADNSISDDDPDPTKDNGDKDAELERIRNMVSLYQKFYQEYKKLSEYMGNSSSLSLLRQSEDFSTVFGWNLKDVKNYADSLDELISGLEGTTEARRKFIDETNASKSSKRREGLADAIKTRADELDQELKELDTRYNTYRKIVEATGNVTLANAVAFGVSSDTPADKHNYYRQSLMDRMGWSADHADRVLGLSQDEINAQYGENSVVSKLWQANQDNTIDKLKEIKDLYVDLITKHQTISDKIAAEDAQYEEQKQKLEALKDTLSEEEYNTRRSSLDKTHAQTIGGLKFEQFKENSGWERIFSDLDRVSVATIRNLLSGLGGVLSTNDMTAEDIKSVVQAMDKLREAVETRSPFRSIAEGYGKLNLLEQIRSLGVDGKYAVTKEQAGSLGLKWNSTGTYTDADLDDVESETTKGFENSIKGVQEQFNALQSVLSPVTSLFDALGNKTLSGASNMAGNAFSSAVSVGTGLSNLGKMTGGSLGKALGKAGPYAAAAAAGLSVVTAIVSMKSSSMKAYEKQAEYLKRIESTTSDINSSLKESLSGKHGASAVKAGQSILSNYDAEAAEVRKTYLKWAKARKKLFSRQNAKKTGIDFDELNTWLIASGWNGLSASGQSLGTINAKNIQELSGAWLEKYKNSHAESWSEINETAAEYLDKLIDIEGEQGKLADTMDEITEAITGMNFDSLSSDFASLLNDMDSEVEDFADKFESYLREAILNGMVTNMFADEISSLIKTAESLGSNNAYIDKNGNVRTKTGGESASDILSEYTSEEYAALKEALNELSEEQTYRRDLLKDMYGWTDDDDASMSSSIKSISESQADLLAGYVNAIRADVSVSRQLETTYFAKFDAVTQAQLEQLGSVAANTLRNAEAAERIEAAVGNVYDIINKATTGARQFNVRVS